ncbi:MAG: flagellar basal body-associated FliL family protein [Armatimonadota bacterium]
MIGYILSGRHGKKLVLLLVAVLLVVLLAGIGVFVLKGRSSKGKNRSQEEKPTATLNLGEFVVNLADKGELRYLKTTIVLAVSGEVPSTGGHGGENGPSPAVRDAVIAVLSSKRFEELNTPEGKAKLKKELISAVNGRLEGCKAVDVYFNDFAMQ